MECHAIDVEIVCSGGGARHGHSGARCRPRSGGASEGSGRPARGCEHQPRDPPSGLRASRAGTPAGRRAPGHPHHRAHHAQAAPRQRRHQPGRVRLGDEGPERLGASSGRERHRQHRGVEDDAVRLRPARSHVGLHPELQRLPRERPGRSARHLRGGPPALPGHHP